MPNMSGLRLLKKKINKKINKKKKGLRLLVSRRSIDLKWVHIQGWRGILV